MIRTQLARLSVVFWQHSLWLLAALLVSLRLAHSCAVVDLYNRHSYMEGEDVALVWDAAAHKEHFIRRASFGSDAERLGFLVPTPGVPELGEEKDALFDELEKAIQPDVARFKLEWTFMGSGSAAPQASGTPASVEILKWQSVGGYNAVVLRAEDPRALTEWLKSQGFQSSPALEAWLKPYVEKKFVITAFKLATEHGTIRTQPVRLSFRTERPFFPYREPKASGEWHATRIYFLSDQRYAGRLENGDRWEHQLLHSDRFAGCPSLAAGLHPSWLTALGFSGSRSDGDLYFEPSAEGRYRPPAVENSSTFHIYGEFVVMLVVVCGFVWLRTKRS